MPAQPTVRCVVTAELDAAELAEIRSLLDAAFAGDPDGEFGDDDWDHTLGGLHGLMVLRAGPSAAVDLTAPIQCEDRPGDCW